MLVCEKNWQVAQEIDSLLCLHDNAEVDTLRYICASYQRAVSHFRCVDSYSLRIFSENTKFHREMPIKADQKLDFEQIFQVKHILYSAFEFEVNMVTSD